MSQIMLSQNQLPIKYYCFDDILVIEFAANNSYEK